MQHVSSKAALGRMAVFRCGIVRGGGRVTCGWRQCRTVERRGMGGQSIQSADGVTPRRGSKDRHDQSHPLNILDLVHVTEGGTINEALNVSMAVTQHADPLGRNRLRYAEITTLLI